MSSIYERQDGLHVVGGKRRGRPSLDGERPSSVISVRVPATEFDRLCSEAKSRRQDLADYLRDRLRLG